MPSISYHILGVVVTVTRRAKPATQPNMTPGDPNDGAEWRPSSALRLAGSVGLYLLPLCFTYETLRSCI
jgi:hypothetical protein